MHELDDLLETILCIPHGSGRDVASHLAPLLAQLRSWFARAAENDSEPDARRITERIKRFREEARARGWDAMCWPQILRVAEPKYFGVCPLLDQELARLQLVRGQRTNRDPCECRLRAGHAYELGPERERLDLVARHDDDLDGWEEYRCKACGALWRLYDRSSEQYSSWVWELHAPGRYGR